MNFLKELLQLQQQQSLIQISDKLSLSNYDKEQYIKKYSKKNYCLIKISNCKIRQNRVHNTVLLSNLQCDHNPSLSR
jgi:hypothetical protein